MENRFTFALALVSSQHELEASVRQVGGAVCVAAAGGVAMVP